jgi:hypothetical protein
MEKQMYSRQTAFKLGLLSLVLWAPTPAATNDALDDPVLEAKFQGPEAAQNQSAYMRQVAEWLELGKSRHPDWSDSQIIDVRKNLFMRHHCTPASHS